MFKRSFVVMAVAGALLASCGGSTSVAVFGGSGHVAVHPDGGKAVAGTPVVFTPLVTDSMSGVTGARRVVIRDEASWRRLWSEHHQYRDPVQDVPQIDFTRQMLVAVFAGARPNACHSTSVLRIAAADGRLQVQVEERDISAVAQCLAVVAHPMQVVALERSDASVDFVKVKGEDVAARTVDSGKRSRIDTPRQVVVRDSAAWERLWAQHNGNEAPLPAIDFSREFIIGVFGGAQPTGCHNSGIERVIRVDDRLLVRQVDVIPGPAVNCVMMMVYPAHLVAVARAEAGDGAAVEFSKEVRLLQ